MVCGLRDDRCEPLLSDANALLKNVNYCDGFRDLVGDLTAEIFDVSETQAETVVEPDGVTDDFRGEIGICDSWAAGS